MLIQKFFAPLDDVTEQGLKEINMSRLGRFVALAGKNGSGKSRILNKLETYIQSRQNTLSNQANFREQLKNNQAALNSQPTSPHAKDWKAQIESFNLQFEIAFNRIISTEQEKIFKAVRFVPKKLELMDPRNFKIQDLTTRFDSAKQPGLDGYEQHCLFYIHQLQNRWWNADHQRFSGTLEEKSNSISAYEELQEIVQNLLGVKLDRTLNGEPSLFGKSIADAALSDGQKVILQLCVALHAQGGELDNTIFLLDEPENHLHPSASIELLEALYKLTDSSQIWVATHSIPLLAYMASIEPMSLWYVDDGLVTNAGRKPKLVLDSLLGDDARIDQLNIFTGLPAQMASINYAIESLNPPKVMTVNEKDPQVSQIQKMFGKYWTKDVPLSVLDFGAGKGRLLDGLAADLISKGGRLDELINYFAFDLPSKDCDICKATIKGYFHDGNPRHFNSRDNFFEEKDEECIDVVVMCNVFHEISPKEWLNIFSNQSLVARAMKSDGYLLIVEDQRIPVGEKAHEYGFLVLDTSHLKTLFNIKQVDIDSGYFVRDDCREDGRLKAHLISKSLLSRISSDSINNSIRQLKETAKDSIKSLRGLPPTYANGQLNGFWTQQFANASLFLDEIEAEVR